MPSHHHFGKDGCSQLHVGQRIKGVYVLKSLGNHELDEGVDGLVPFIRNLTAPVLAANLILNKVTQLQNEPNLYDSVVLIKRGKKIGVIGYLTPETQYLAPKNDIEYEDEVIAIRREVLKLKDKGVNIIIALGHSGFLKDLEIARDVQEVDLVIGGHSNTFLWNSVTDETPEIPQGPYPTIVTQPSGKQVPVVQAYAFTKYMGKLHLTFDENGELIKFDGNPILLNQDIPNDPEILEIIDKYRDNVDRINNEVVGSSTVFLDGEQCRIRECNLANFINDATIAYTKNFSKEYSDINIALTQGGRIRTSINRPEKPFELTKGDWMAVIPFSDPLVVSTINGSMLMKALEHSVDSWRTIDATGQFLHFSNMKVTYDLAKPPGSRVVEALAICSNCTELTEIRMDYEYRTVMSEFLADGGDGYMFSGLQKEYLPYNEVQCVLDYLSRYSPIDPLEDNRIVLLNEDKVEMIPDLIKFTTNLITANQFLPSSALSNRSVVESALLCLLFLYIL